MEATEAVLEFLEGTPVGSRSSGMARDRARSVSVRRNSEGEWWAGPASGCISFVSLLFFFYSLGDVEGE